LRVTDKKLQMRLKVRSGWLTQERPTRFCLGFSPYNKVTQREEGEMESEEIEEFSEAKKSGEKEIGLTMAIVAVLLAFATTMGHRTHTEEVLIQTKANDQWAYHQAKNIRSHMYEANSEMAGLIKEGASAAEDFRKKSEDQKQGAEAIRVKGRRFRKRSRNYNSSCRPFRYFRDLSRNRNRFMFHYTADRNTRILANLFHQ
jgi:Domain of unknown function (DUF4337)